MFEDIVIPEPPTFNVDLSNRPEAIRNTNVQIGDMPDFARRGVPAQLPHELRKPLNFQVFLKNYCRVLLGVDENLASPRLPRQGKAGWRPLLEGSNAAWRESWLYENFEYPTVHCAPKARGVRTSRYKLIHYIQTPEAHEFFDLEKDPGERRSVYDDPAYEQQVAQLTADSSGSGPSPETFAAKTTHRRSPARSGWRVSYFVALYLSYSAARPACSGLPGWITTR